MKVLTLNCHSWMEKNALEKLEQLVLTIEREQFDIIALQEVNQLITTKAATLDDYFQPLISHQPIVHQDNFALKVVEKLKKLGVNYYWSWNVSHLGYDRYHEGAALLSKNPIQPDDFLVSKVSDIDDFHTRRILKGRTVLGETELVVFSCHYSWWLGNQQEEGFYYEWNQTIEKMTRMASPLLLLGDFNNPADNCGEGYDYLKRTKPELQDAFKVAKNKTGEHTVSKAIDGWSENTQNLRLDYGFISSEFHVEEYRVVFDGKQTPIISDHFGIVLTLSLK